MQPELLDTITKLRPALKVRRDKALSSVKDNLTVKDMHEIKLDLIECAHLVRWDVELLLRVSYWTALSEKELGDRIVLDEGDLLSKFLKRINLSPESKADFESMWEEGRQKLSGPIKKIEDNSQLLGLVKKEVADIYQYFYAILTKFCHPDPYSIFFPEILKDQIYKELFNIFDTGCRELDIEWDLLKIKMAET